MIHLPYCPHHWVSPIRGLKLSIHIILDTVRGFLDAASSLRFPYPSPRRRTLLRDMRRMNQITPRMMAVKMRAIAR